MFEEESKEYANGKGHEHYNYLFEENARSPKENAGSPADFARWCFQDGAEFGYNKANEWHYVKDEDLPITGELVLIYWGEDNLGNTVIQTGRLDSLGNWYGRSSNYPELPIAWKEIVLP